MAGAWTLFFVLVFIDEVKDKIEFAQRVDICMVEMLLEQLAFID